MRYVFVLGLGIKMAVILAGCEGKLLRPFAGCQPVSESIYVNPRFSPEPYSPDSAKVFTFENGFSDTITVWIGNDRVASQYIQTTTSGLAGRVVVNRLTNPVIRLRTGAGQCARFHWRDGYRYVYVNKSEKNWQVAYSNYSRIYF